MKSYTHTLRVYKIQKCTTKIKTNHHANISLQYNQIKICIDKITYYI